MKMKFTKNLIKKKVVVLASHMLYYTCRSDKFQAINVFFFFFFNFIYLTFFFQFFFMMSEIKTKSLNCRGRKGRCANFKFKVKTYYINLHHSSGFPLAREMAQLSQRFKG